MRMCSALAHRHIGAEGRYNNICLESHTGIFSLHFSLLISWSDKLEKNFFNNLIVYKNVAPLLVLFMHCSGSFGC